MAVQRKLPSGNCVAAKPRKYAARQQAQVALQLQLKTPALKVGDKVAVMARKSADEEVRETQTLRNTSTAARARQDAGNPHGHGNRSLCKEAAHRPHRLCSLNGHTSRGLVDAQVPCDEVQGLALHRLDRLARRPACPARAPARKPAGCPSYCKPPSLRTVCACARMIGQRGTAQPLRERSPSACASVGRIGKGQRQRWRRPHRQAASMFRGVSRAPQRHHTRAVRSGLHGNIASTVRAVGSVADFAPVRASGLSTRTTAQTVSTRPVGGHGKGSRRISRIIRFTA